MNTANQPQAEPGQSMQAIAAELAALSRAVLDLTKSIGPRLTRAEMLTRRGGICRNTLTRQIETGLVPRPGKDGKWLRAEVIEWEAMERARKAACTELKDGQ